MGELTIPKAYDIGANKQYKINFYLRDGALSADSVRGELVDGSKTKNIYRQYRESDADVVWLSENEVEINGIRLDVTCDVYDWRRNNSSTTSTEWQKKMIYR